MSLLVSRILAVCAIRRNFLQRASAFLSSINDTGVLFVLSQRYKLLFETSCFENQIWKTRMPIRYQRFFFFHVRRVTRQVLRAVEGFFHIEAMSGIILLVAAGLALIWSNSSFYESYDALWRTPVSLRFGMEIRQEIHGGALSCPRQAAFPLIAAFGGVCLPALVYLFLNSDSSNIGGWAIPTATDIAFAVGVLALLGKSIPANIRIVLLSLAVIDDIIAVVIIAIFYSIGLNPEGFMIAGVAIFLIFLMQWFGVEAAFFYIFPAIILWTGFFHAGVHPSLAGVVLGLLTPVFPFWSTGFSINRLVKAMERIKAQTEVASGIPQITFGALRDIRNGGRNIVAPVTRVKMALHPWVAFIVMPLFSFSNAGVRFETISFSGGGEAFFVMFGVGIGLVVGKPAGILLASFFVVRTGICRLPPNVSWSGVVLVGLLAGIGFTMSIFVAMLAFDDTVRLSFAKAGVFLGSAISGSLGIFYGFLYSRWSKNKVIS